MRKAIVYVDFFSLNTLLFLIEDCILEFLSIILFSNFCFCVGPKIVLIYARPSNAVRCFDQVVYMPTLKL